MGLEYIVSESIEVAQVAVSEAEAGESSRLSEPKEKTIVAEQRQQLK